MNHILCCRQSALTAVELADALGISATKSIASDADTVINWGCSSEYVSRLDHVPCVAYINRPKSCSEAIDKLAMLCALRQVVSAPVPIPMPKDPMVWAKINKVPTAQSSLVARASRHMDGSGFMLVRSMEDLASACEQDYDYLMPFIPSVDEYRVHIFGGKAIACEKKKNNNPDANQTCRCSRYGWKMVKHLIGRAPLKVIDAAKRAMSHTSLDFGAVDVLVGVDGIAYVLEINTAPFLSGWLIERYAERLRPIVNVDSNLPLPEEEDNDGN